MAAAVVLGVVVLFGAAAVGQAQPQGGGKSEVQPAHTAGFLSLGKENGYEVALSMPSDRVVLFYAVRFERRKHADALEYSIYATHNLGDLEHGVVRARFGSFGRVALWFRPDGRVRKGNTSSACKGGPVVTESGRFVGHLDFRGKQNFFHISSARGKASLAHSPRLRCEKGEALETLPRSLRKYVAPAPLLTDNHSIALLYSSARDHGRHVGIAAVHEEGSPPGADVQLEIVESGHGMAIGHGVYLQGPRGTLLTSLPGEHPATATLAPPAPFFGKAVYSEENESWSGALGVKLAGFTVPLTGPDFHVHLCVANPIKDRNGCEFFKAETPPDERPARPAGALR